MRVFTVIGTDASSRMAATHSATRAGRAMRAAPKHPRCTRGLGQPTLRLTSSYPASSARRAHRARSAGSLAPQLDRHRMLGRIEAKRPPRVTVEQGAGRDHLGIEPRAAAEDPQQVAGVPVRAPHHGGDAETVRAGGRDHAPDHNGEGEGALLSAPLRSPSWRAAGAPAATAKGRRRSWERERPLRGDGAANVTWRTPPGSAGILPARVWIRGPANPCGRYARAPRAPVAPIRPDRSCNPESIP